ncbi:ABC transporter permease [Corynebacterium choanae]|uniref:ABC transporter permease YtrF n=1 Tax=Corynebacterium choanae TaxID=1862358 RepID=A0A3G6J7T2_9CORY|nr:ABC transporter permease [Corynebacterium choanae]AZA12500.1 ABC transporter permease YtrF precursor [Corynebacterium choanae]
MGRRRAVLFRRGDDSYGNGTGVVSPPQWRHGRRVMRTIGWRSVLAHRVRLLLTLLSVAIGTAFMTGSAMFTAQLEDSFSAIVSSLFDDVDIAVTGGPGSSGLDAAAVAALRDDPRIAKVTVTADPSAVVAARVGGGLLDTGGAPSQAVAMTAAGDALGAGQLTAGRVPAASGEVAVNETALQRNSLAVGDKIVVIAPSFTENVTIVGAFASPRGADTGGWLGVAFAEDDYVARFGTDGKVQLASVTLAGLTGSNQHHAATGAADWWPWPPAKQDEVSQSAADETAFVERGTPAAASRIAAVEATISEQFPQAAVLEGRVLSEQATASLQQGLAFVRYFLWAFAGIALLVAMFLISNTFAMIVAQRTKEFALLRAVGAASRQITTAVTVEATAIGVVGSAVGILGGIGLVKFVSFGMAYVGVGLPTTGLVASPAAIITPLLVGTVLTMIAGFVPARRAGAIPPVAAMSAVHVEQPVAGVSWRWLSGLLALSAGATILLAPVAVTITATATARAALAGAGAALLIVGLWLAGPGLAARPTTAIAQLFARGLGAAGKLAAANARRYPKRNASTAFALTLGLLMVTTIGMFGASMKASLTSMIDTTVTADLVVKGPTASQLTIPAPLAAQLADDPALGDVTVLRTAYLTVAGSPRGVPGGRPKSTNVAAVDFTPGASGLALQPVDGTLDLVHNAGIIIDEQLAEATNTHVGDMLPIGGERGDQYPATVVGIYAVNTGLGEAIIAETTARAIVGEDNLAIQNLFITAPQSTADSRAAARRTVQQAADEYQVVEVLTREEFASQSERNVNTLLAVLYGLLTLAVITAILGIVNTLGLSVIERRSELGMLRIVGAGRRQIRTMIYTESVVIAVYGALVGLAAGLLIGYGFLTTLSSEGITTIAVDTRLLVGMLPAAILIGIGAAALPARVAANTDLLTAIEAE